MNGFTCPPFSLAADETVVSDSPAFSTCKDVLGEVASKLSGSVTDQQYSLSKEWGKIVRARIPFLHNGLKGTALVTCWSNSGSGVKLAAKMDCC
jgi:hypothetical protein